MAKNELINAGRLTRAQISGKKLGGILGFLIVIQFFFLTDLSAAIYRIFKENDGIDYYQFADNSFFWIFGMSFAFIIFNCMYRYNNQNFAVYPQTNNSRYLSFQMITYTYLVLVPLTLMVVYLIQYGVIAAIAAGRDNVHLMFNFDISFVLAGFVVMILYMAILAAIINLISVLLRKFKLYAAAFFSAVLVLGLTNLSVAMDIFAMLTEFLIYENSLWKFILKALVSWAILFTVAALINKYTVYYKTRNNKMKSERLEIIIAIAVGVVLAIFVVFAVLRFNENLYDGPDGGAESSVASPDNNSSGSSYTPSMPPQGELEFDISHLPRGSNITVQVSGDVIIIPNSDKIVGWGNSSDYQFLFYEDGTEIKYSREQMTIMLPSELDNIQGDTLHVYYSNPWQVVDNTEIGHLVNAEFEARFEGNVLYIHYTFDKNVKAVFMPLWSFMWQFEHFKGKGLFSEDVFGTYASSSANVNIWISDNTEYDGPWYDTPTPPTAKPLP